MSLNKPKFLQKNSLKFKIWGYLIVFCTIIIVFLWLFQVVSFKSYYEFSTKKDIFKIAKKIQKNGTDEEMLNQLSYDYGVCIELYENNHLSFSSSECRSSIPANFKKYKNLFIEEGKEEQGYEIVNDNSQMKSFLYGLSFDSKYVFLTVSLQPVDSTVSILKTQLFLTKM